MSTTILLPIACEAHAVTAIIGDGYLATSRDRADERGEAYAVVALYCHDCDEIFEKE